MAISILNSTNSGRGLACAKRSRREEEVRVASWAFSLRKLEEMSLQVTISQGRFEKGHERSTDKVLGVCGGGKFKGEGPALGCTVYPVRRQLWARALDPQRLQKAETGGEPIFRGWKGISDGQILGEKHTVRAEGQCVSQSMCKGGIDTW